MTTTDFRRLLTALGRESSTIRLAHAATDGGFHVFPAGIDEAEEFIAENPDRHIWFEINESSYRQPEGRSSSRDITRLAALYVDIDYKDTGMGSPDAALQLVDDLASALTVPPAALVSSGHGLQAYWPLKDGAVNEASRPDIALLLARWKEMCTRFASANGGAIDSVFDLPRIFRVPGSFNVKTDTPVLVTATFPQGSESLTVEEVQGIFDDWGIEASPREIPSGQISASASWRWAISDCQHVDTIRREWANAHPNARHPWLLAQAAMLHGMIRYGCVTEATFEQMRIDLDLRFQALLAEDGIPRHVGGNEVAAAYRWGLEQATLWSNEKLIDEMRTHPHSDLLDFIASTQRSSAASPQAAPRNQHLATVTNLFSRQQAPQSSTAGTFGALALQSQAAQSRLATVPHTDVGNAELFAQEIAGRYCFVPDKGWHAWNGVRWTPDELGRHREAYKDLFTQRLIATVDPQETSWLHGSLNGSRMNAAIRLAETVEGVAVSFNDMDRNVLELATPNGIVDLLTGNLRPTDPLRDRHLKITNVAPHFETPTRFLEFLRWMFSGDQEMIDYVQRLLGLALIGELRDQIFPVMLGPGANGKSTLIDLLIDILGDYAAKLPARFLVASKNEQIPEALAALSGKRIAFASEVPPNAKFDEELVKAITGDKHITARKLHENSRTFSNTVTLFGVFNNYLTLTAGGKSWWRRQRIMKLYNVLPDEQQDPTFGQRLFELEGAKVLGWMIQGTQRYLAAGEQVPQKVRTTVEEFRRTEDTMARFVHENLEFDATMQVTRQAVYLSFVNFAKTNRMFDSLPPEPKFVRDFLTAHPAARIMVDGVEDDRFFGGLRLKGGYVAPEVPFQP